MSVNYSQVPKSVKQQLAELDLELSEGDVTEKGYEKKRSRLLREYIGNAPSARITSDSNNNSVHDVGEPSTSAAVEGGDGRRRSKVTRENERFQSEIRSEAVFEALQKFGGGFAPEASRRQPLKFCRQPSGDWSTDDEGANSTLESGASRYDNHSHLSPPDVTQVGGSTIIPDGTEPLFRGNVSAKIQQLLVTLKRPKPRPLAEYYEDDADEILTIVQDPLTPQPSGANVTPYLDDSFELTNAMPKSLEAALLKHSSSKLCVAYTVDALCKLKPNLTYAKLASRSKKLAYTLQCKLKEPLKQGDRVAIAIPSNDPASFLISFYACLFAGMTAVPVELPLSSNKRDTTTQKMGFLLGSLGCRLVLTNSSCYEGLPKDVSGAAKQLKSWPVVEWLLVTNYSSPGREWAPAIAHADVPALIEYSYRKDGQIVGCSVSRGTLLRQCQTLCMTCSYAPAESLITVLDFKRELGFWHSVAAAVYAGLQCIYIPFSQMKTDPTLWLRVASKQRLSLALTRSRDLHWSILSIASLEAPLNLSTLRFLAVADGANPWSVTSVDNFVKQFKSRGLRAEVISPCSYTSEGLTVSTRRPGRKQQPSGRGNLLMDFLSYGIVKLDPDKSLSSLTVQDCGGVLPGSAVTLLKMESNQLAQTDELGEICLRADYCATAYHNLPGLSEKQFKISVGDAEYTRSSLVGFLGPGGLVFVTGDRHTLVRTNNRRHSTDDMIATVLAVEPQRFVHRGRLAIFCITLLKEERIVIVAEQKLKASEEDCFAWMSRVLQVVDLLHKTGVYCLALVPPNRLPRNHLGNIAVFDTMRMFTEGTLHPSNILMCPHTCILNLPEPRIQNVGVGAAAMHVGALVAGSRLAYAHGSEISPVDDSSRGGRTRSLGEILMTRAQTAPDHQLYTFLTARCQALETLTAGLLHKRAERIACLLLERGQLTDGERVAILLPPGNDLVACVFACFFIGAVPVLVRPPQAQNLKITLPTARLIIEVSQAKCVLTNKPLAQLLRSKSVSNLVAEGSKLPNILDIETSPKKKLASVYKPDSGSKLCYVDFTVSTAGSLLGTCFTHDSIEALCRSIKLQCELYPSRELLLALDIYSGLPFVLSCLLPVYAGHRVICLPQFEFEQTPSAWLWAVSQFHVRDCFVSYAVLELSAKCVAPQMDQLRQKGYNLALIRSCIVVSEERPRVSLINNFTKLFSALGLHSRTVSATFGCGINLALCLQPTNYIAPAQVFVDLKSLRNDRVAIVERGAPNSVPLLECGKLLPGVKVAIANPETRAHCADSHLGEIWVSSPHNATSYFLTQPDDVFSSKLASGDTKTAYARTGYLGFLRRTDSTSADGHKHDALFVVGPQAESIVLKGMRYHPVDLEATIQRLSPRITEAAVFSWSSLLVAVVELDVSENAALDFVAQVTTALLTEHYVICGVVVLVDPGSLPVNSRGEKQRIHLRDAFVADRLDPIYVAYNL